MKKVKDGLLLGIDGHMTELIRLLGIINETEVVKFGEESCVGALVQTAEMHATQVAEKLCILGFKIKEEKWESKN